MKKPLLFVFSEALLLFVAAITYEFIKNPEISVNTYNFLSFLLFVVIPSLMLTAYVAFKK